MLSNSILCVVTIDIDNVLYTTSHWHDDAPDYGLWNVNPLFL